MSITNQENLQVCVSQLASISDEAYVNVKSWKLRAYLR